VNDMPIKNQSVSGEKELIELVGGHTSN
jgi:hypothetical protein